MIDQTQEKGLKCNFIANRTRKTTPRKIISDEQRDFGEGCLRWFSVQTFRRILRSHLADTARGTRQIKLDLAKLGISSVFKKFVPSRRTRFEIIRIIIFTTYRRWGDDRRLDALIIPCPFRLLREQEMHSFHPSAGESVYRYCTSSQQPSTI